MQSFVDLVFVAEGFPTHDELGLRVGLGNRYVSLVDGAAIRGYLDRLVCHDDTLGGVHTGLVEPPGPARHFDALVVGLGLFQHQGVAGDRSDEGVGGDDVVVNIIQHTRHFAAADHALDGAPLGFYGLP